MTRHQGCLPSRSWKAQVAPFIATREAYIRDQRCVMCFIVVIFTCSCSSFHVCVNFLIIFLPLSLHIPLAAAVYRSALREGTAFMMLSGTLQAWELGYQ